MKTQLSPHVEKKLAVAIWTSEEFRGTKEDARRIARQQAHGLPDLFSTHLFEMVETEQPPVEENPDQLTLF